jgi:hypothetical protein
MKQHIMQNTRDKNWIEFSKLVIIGVIFPNNIRILCYTSIPCMQIIVEFTHKKTKNIGHFGWISDKVSTAQSIFDQCPFRFALHRTKGTRIFYRLVDVYSNDLYVHLCIGSNCTDTTIPLQFYVRVDIVLTCGNHLHDRIISSLRVEFEPIKLV